MRIGERSIHPLLHGDDMTWLLIPLIGLALWNARSLHNLHKKIEQNMSTILERFEGVNARLDEAASEILALIQELRDQGVTPEAEAVLVQIEAKAQALADIVPNPPSPQP